MAQKPEDPLDGVRCFSIGGRMVTQRQRCLGMTDEERRWRAQWVKDQVLTPNEPRNVPEYYKDTTNIFRRMYKTPMHWFYNALKSKLGPDKAFVIRHFVGKCTLILLGTYVTTYYLKYHTNNFLFYRSIELIHKRKPMLPYHPDYPNYYVKKPYEYYDQGFYSSVLCQDAEPPEPPPEEPPKVDEELCSPQEQK